jgi:hypothetical protein
MLNVDLLQVVPNLQEPLKSKLQFISILGPRRVTCGWRKIPTSIPELVWVRYGSRSWVKSMPVPVRSGT